jgi:uncharacterized RDD family membrane protein YckC
MKLEKNLMGSGDYFIAGSELKKSRPRDGMARPASFKQRSGAFLFDYILTLLIPALALIVAGYVKRRWQSPETANIIMAIGYLLTAGLMFLNFVFLYVQGGQSFGKRLIGIRVMRVNGSPVDYQTAILRHILGYPLSFLGLGLGMLWPIWDSKRQGWHDKLANTVVIVD